MQVLETTVARRPHVLVAEAQASLRSLVTEVLSFEGCRVTEVSSALEMQEALNAGQALGVPFDLVVADVNIPQRYSLATLLAAGGPRLIVMAFPDEADVEQLRALGAKLLTKPFGLGELRYAVASATTAHSGARRA